MIKVLAVVVVLGATTERCSWGVRSEGGDTARRSRDPVATPPPGESPEQMRVRVIREILHDPDLTPEQRLSLAEEARQFFAKHPPAMVPDAATLEKRAAKARIEREGGRLDTDEDGEVDYWVEIDPDGTHHSFRKLPDGTVREIRTDRTGWLLFDSSRPDMVISRAVGPTIVLIRDGKEIVRTRVDENNDGNPDVEVEANLEEGTFGSWTLDTHGNRVSVAVPEGSPIVLQYSSAAGACNPASGWSCRTTFDGRGSGGSGASNLAGFVPFPEDRRPSAGGATRPERPQSDFAFVASAAESMPHLWILKRVADERFGCDPADVVRLKTQYTVSPRRSPS